MRPFVLRAWKTAAVAVLAAALLLACTQRAPSRAPTRPPAARPTPKGAALEEPTPGADAEAVAPPAEGDPFASIDAAIAEALAAGKMPGCVVVVGRHDEILLRRAHGSRSVRPSIVPMTTDTLFDLASLTKPIATTTSVMLLVDRGKLDLDEPVSHRLPELAKLPPFTARHLLLHTSGLPAGTPLADYTPERAPLLKRLGRLRNVARPGERFVYSDVGFVVLEELVRRITQEDLATFTTREIFTPLAMTETTFLPGPGLRARAAPTEQRGGAWMAGEVHDPRAFALGGVAGNAGLFSTADDLARFAQAMLDGTRLVSARTRDAFLARHETPRGGRALGWDMDSRPWTSRSPLLSPRAFGHGGFTGTALWLDPERDLFVVFLSNRVHPDGKGAVNPLVAEVATRAVRATDVQPGIDVLRDAGFAALQGSSGVALITNASARARDGTRTADVLRAAPGVTLRRIFSPEHGFGAEREGKIADATYEGIPVTSLYGERTAPTGESLDGVDTMVLDLQDAGVRFYTYASTMKRAMKVAAERKLRFVVLDRPNPIGGARVEGPVLEADATSFVNHHALPVRHGMTMGELARLFAADEKLDLRLDVVKVAGWRRKDEHDRTGLAWVSPSPNLRSVTAARLYPALGLLEGTNVSVGRGTDTPFEVLGAPFLDGDALVRRLSEANLAGVGFEATSFTPKSSVHAGKPCRGVKVHVVDRATFEPVRTGVAIALALHELAGSAWKDEGLDRLIGDRETTAAIRAGRPLTEIERAWSERLSSFVMRRESFLLYR